VVKIAKALVLGGLLAGVAVGEASAQSIGFKIGPTFSKIDVEDFDDDFVDDVTSWGGGAFARFAIKGIGLQVELLGISKGYAIENAIGDEDAELKITYIEIPVTAMIPLGQYPYGFLGPFVAFETGCKGSIGELSGECDDNDGSRSTFDWGVTAGAGVHIPAGPGAFLLEARYTHGFANLNEVEDEGSINSRYWGIFAGYSIAIF
jgi:hypothetical protein